MVLRTQISFLYTQVCQDPPVIPEDILLATRGSYLLSAAVEAGTGERLWAGGLRGGLVTSVQVAVTWVALHAPRIRSCSGSKVKAAAPRSSLPRRTRCSIYPKPTAENRATPAGHAWRWALCWRWDSTPI
jgi:hypothetical protein